MRFICRGKRDDNGIRIGCGEDLTEIIEAVPADGEEREYECPKCGNTGDVMKTPGGNGE